MYKNNSKNMQRRAERISVKDIISEGDILPEKERRDFLKKKLAEMDGELLLLPKKCREREEIGKRKFLLQCEMKRLKGRKRPDMGNCIIEAAKLILPKPTLDALFDEAKRIYDIRNPQRSNDPLHDNDKIIERQIEDGER